MQYFGKLCSFIRDRDAHQSKGIHVQLQYGLIPMSRTEHFIQNSWSPLEVQSYSWQRTYPSFKIKDETISWQGMWQRCLLTIVLSSHFLSLENQQHWDQRSNNLLTKGVAKVFADSCSVEPPLTSILSITFLIWKRDKVEWVRGENTSRIILAQLLICYVPWQALLHMLFEDIPRMGLPPHYLAFLFPNEACNGDVGLNILGSNLKRCFATLKAVTNIQKNIWSTILLLPWK